MYEDRRQRVCTARWLREKVPRKMWASRKRKDKAGQGWAGQRAGARSSAAMAGCKAGGLELSDPLGKGREV